MKENLFTFRENLGYCLSLAGLYVRGLDYTTQSFLWVKGRMEETACFQIGKLKEDRQEEIRRRKSIIGNG